ncbi:MAG: V-type ATP synthase subunit I [Halobacteriaceae archaeon]
MLRPKRMSKVSVTGSKRVMTDVIEAAHDQNALHLSDYDESWEGFATGSPIEGAEEASAKLVTIRSLKSILGVTEEDAGPSRIVTEDAIDEQLEEIRQTVNDLDDRRADIRDDLRTVEERLDGAEPFVDLGIDLDLLRGHEHLEVAVGTADPTDVEAALAHADDLRAYEVFTGEETVAVAAYPSEGAGDDVLADVLVGVEFAHVEVPDASGDPEDYVAELEHEQQRLESRLQSVEGELEDRRLEHAGFLLAAEERLAIEVQKAEAPLRFATTENAFVAEGWVPTRSYADLVETLRDAVGDRIEIEELERADYDERGAHGHDHGESGGDASSAEGETQRTAADGGQVVEMSDSPPVIQDNPGVIKPFELLVETINRPKYSEFDPTVVLFLTFPVFYGFMIGDFGYGLLYTAAGYYLATRFDSAAMRSLGGIATWAGGFTMLFGLLYGEVFGLHVLGDIVWAGHPPMHKGLQPHFIPFALVWLTASLAVALLHLTVGYLFDFRNLWAQHGLRDAVTESGSWILLMLGVWTWVFSTHAASYKPTFLYEALNVPGAALPGGGTAAAENIAYAVGFGGLPAGVGVGALAVAALGFALLLLGEGGLGLIESLNVLVNVLSYARIAAVLLAKAGMALAVNILVFGAELHEGEFHFLFVNGIDPTHVPAEELVFSGLFNGGVAAFVFGLVVLVLGHGLVLALGVTSAGLQAVRLEYVEFFGKFYEGGGEKYEPFGYDRTFTTED